MGTITISIDAELGWGFHDLDHPPMDRIETARNGWLRLRDLFEEYSIPATWAVVGHLLLDDCDGYHRDHPAGPDWFGREAGDWRDRPDLRFGDGLVEDLQAASVDHDIGCHTFSHVPLGRPETSEEIVHGELQRCLDVADQYGLSMKSFVFPRNRMGHRELLGEYGIETYRGPRPGTWAERSETLQQVGKVLRGTVPGTSPPIVQPRIDEYGLVDIPASLYLFGFEGRARTVAETLYADPIVLKARRGIDAAANDSGVFHMWLHPNNLVEERDFGRMHAILSYIDQRRQSGAVDVATMDTVAERTREETIEKPRQPVR